MSWQVQEVLPVFMHKCQLASLHARAPAGIALPPFVAHNSHNCQAYSVYTYLMMAMYTSWILIGF